MSFTAYSANEILQGNLIDHTNLWLQVHTTEPGLLGTSGVSAASPTRVAVGAVTVVSNVLTNNADIGLASDGTGTDLILWFSLWDAVSAGNCLYTNGELNPGITFTAPDVVIIAAGDLSITLRLGI